MSRIAAALFLISTLTAQQIPGERQTVSGVVVDSSSGQPISGALVIAGSPPDESFRQVTDAAGAFSFSIPNPKETILYVSRRGYMPPVSGGAIFLSAQPDLAKLRIELARLAAIHGKVTNTVGEPLTNIRVELLRQRMVADGRRSFESYKLVLTNDLGEYRLYDLPPGSYYLKVFGPGEITQFGDFPGAEAYAPSYYPGVPDRRSASPIRLAPGQDFRADFTLQGQRAFVVRGRIVNPPAGVSIRLLKGDELVGVRTIINSSKDGFGLVSVPVGDYLLQAYTPDGAGRALAEQSITIADRDLDGISLELVQGRDITARVLFAGEPPLEKVRPSIRLNPRSPERFPWAARPIFLVAGEQGVLTFRDVFPGVYDVVSFAPSHYIASARSGLADALADGLVVTPAGAPPLEIEMRKGTGRLEGTVDGGQMAMVALVRTAGSTISSRPLSIRDGRISIGGLAPGEYSIYAWASGRQFSYGDRAALEAAAKYATVVTMRDGATEQVTVKLLPEEVE